MEKLLRVVDKLTMMAVVLDARSIEGGGVSFSFSPACIRAALLTMISVNHFASEDLRTVRIASPGLVLPVPYYSIVLYLIASTERCNQLLKHRFCPARVGPSEPTDAALLSAPASAFFQIHMHTPIVTSSISRYPKYYTYLKTATYRSQNIYPQTRHPSLRFLP